jgi:Calcineurin-like phosphoesterase
LARHVDDRRIQGLAPANEDFADYSSPEWRDEAGVFGFDFVADTGDGWNSTYAVASMVGKDAIAPLDPNGGRVQLPRGNLLVLGGDLVYPTPSRSSYNQRLLQPFSDAFRSYQGRPPEVLAIPGNHDWYDSLVAFRRLFCTRRRFAGWQSRQSRSYFAARISTRWWLLGVDVQLDHDIDDVQFAFFQRLAERIDPDHAVVLCCAEPYWIADERDPSGGTHHMTLLGSLIDDTLQGRVRCILAGDLHHYRRHRHINGAQLITCGTGGAFLHPTHELPDDSPGSKLEPQASFPTRSESRRLTFLNLLFPIRNPWFGIVPGLTYMMVAWTTGIYIGESFVK